MKPLILRVPVALGALLAGALLTYAQLRPPEEPAPRLKRSQIEAILKDDHKKSLEDATVLLKLSEELKMELEKGGTHTLSLSALKKAEEIEKLAKRIRGRLRRF